MKDHEIARLVNELRDIANEYAGTGQLRGRISECVTTALNPKCRECNGTGRLCMAGCSAHQSNWYDCDVCKGTGRE